MNREYRDLSVNEPDGRLYYDLVDRAGKTVLKGVNPRLISPILQKGDRWSAAAANKLLRIAENGAPVLAIPPKEVGGLCRCNHQKTGAVHALMGDGSDLRFVASADFAAGDTFTLNGAAVSARTISGENLWPGYFKQGSVVLCHVNGSVLTFSGGGGLGSADKETVKAFLAVGHSVLGGQVQGSYTADATAGPDQLSEGAVAYAKGQRIVGRVPLAKGGWKDNPAWRQSSNVVIDDGAVFLNPDGQNYYYSGVSFLGAAVPQLTAANIRTGVRIGSIIGSHVGEVQYQATAVSHQDYDPRDWTKSHLAQDEPALLQDVTPEQSEGRATFRFVRDARVRIRTMSFGNNGSPGSCSLADGWHTVHKGQEIFVYAKVAAHGSGLYRNTVVNISY